jgi:hypothetical protein
MQPPGPPKKKGLSTGCIVALVAVLVFFGSIAAVVMFIGYRFSQDKDVQNVLGAIGEAATIMAEAQSAPGTSELRALGCEQAMAIDPAKMMKIADRLADAGAPPSAAAPDVSRIVMCQVSAFSVAPTCDDAARAYVRGASPTGKFVLTVQKGSSGSNKHCSGVYSSSGTLVSPGGAGGY